MTREEVIEQLKKAYPKCCKEVDYRLVGGFDDHSSPLGQAIDVAIKALEQESCDDCVRRQAVLDEIREVCFSKEQEWVDFRVSQGSNGQRDLIIKFIEDLPSVQPKPETVTDFADRCHECGAKYGKLLKQDSCEDAISRQEVLDVLKDKWNMFSDANDAMQESINAIKALQPVTLKPKERGDEDEI